MLVVFFIALRKDDNMIDLKQGDCLELMKEIPDKSVDMVLCDLPYGTTANQWDKVINFDVLWQQYKRITKDNACIALFSSEPFTFDLVNSNRKMYKYRWYWIKERGAGVQYSHHQPMRKVEEVCIFYKKTPFYDYKGEKLEKPYRHALPIKMSGSSNLSGSDNGDKNSRKYAYFTHKAKNNVLEFARQIKKSVHPTQKPVALLEYLIKTYTQDKDIVLDNCMGSGSTGVACINTNRNFIGYELQQDYFEIAEKRISDAIDARGLFATDEQIARQKR